MEHEAVFQVVESGFDEYPGDGYRLKPVGSNDPGDLVKTTVLAVMGFNTHELQVGDEIRISAKVLSRLVTERKPV